MSSSLLLQLLCLLPLLTLTHAVYFDINTCTEQTPCVHVAPPPTGKDTNNGSISFPFRSVQRALNHVNQTFTVPTKIVLADGIYPGNIVWIGKSVTLTSISGAASTFIDCNRIPNQRGIWIGSGETSTTIVSGVTVRNCRSQMGAGMAIVGETTKPIIKDVVLLNNSATMGGGMLIYFASPSLIGVNFTANQARDGAGVMITHNASMIIPQQLQAMSLALNYVHDENKPLPSGATAAVSITQSTFTENFGAGIGAGYYLMAAYRVSCSRCIFIGGTASGSGAIAAGTRSTLSISDSIFMDNRATTANGGAVSIQQGSTATITHSLFQNNEAKNGGGGVAVGTTGTATVSNCQFNNNRANMGSIVFIDATARAQVTGCTCTNNVAFQQGGILFLSPLSARNANMSTNTFSNNRALGGYGADYGSFPSQLVFVPDNNTEIGNTAITPSLVPINYTRSVTRSINNLDEISLRILLLDTFGQRVDLNSSNQTDLYADVMTLDNITVPALLVESTRVRMPQGLADVSVVLVGAAGATYAVQWSVDTPGVEPIRLLVTILPCDQHAVITYYDQTTFPICHPAASHFISSSFFSAIVVISCILIALVLIVQGLTIWYWSTPVFKTSTPLFMSLMLVGAIIGYLSVILSVIDVDRTSDGLSLFNQICKTQYWMMGVAFVLMFATLALKTWRIRNIFCNSQLTEIRTVNTFALFRWLMVLVAIEMLIHIIWISTDPLHAVMRLNGTRVAATCESSNATAFLITNLVYKGVIALVCVLFAYQTRDVTSRFNESRQLMIASYNMFVCVIVIATLSLALPDVDARRAVYAVGSLFVITSTWFVLFFPKLFVALFHADQNTSLGPATATGSGGKNSLSGGKNSNSGGNRKFSLQKGAPSSPYQQPSSKLSFNNNIHGSSSATASPTRSKAGSLAGTAPGSPVLPTKLSLHLGTRGSMSTTSNPPLSSPVIGSNSPPTAFRTAMIHIPRHLMTATLTPRTPHIHAMPTSDEVIPPLDLTPAQLQATYGGRRTSQPTITAYDASGNNEPGAAGEGASVGGDNFV